MKAREEGRDYIPVLDDIPDDPVKSIFGSMSTDGTANQKYAWMFPSGDKTSADEFLEIADAAGIPVVDTQQ